MGKKKRLDYRNFLLAKAQMCPGNICARRDRQA